MSWAPTDQVSYTTAIDACASVGDAETARRLLDEMAGRGVKPNHRSFNAVMSAYSKANQPNEAITLLGVRAGMTLLLREVRVRVLLREKVWAMEIDTHTLWGGWWMQVMAEHGLSPDVKSYTLAMDICLRRGLWQVALKIVDRMRVTRVCLDAISYGKAIHAAHIGQCNTHVHPPTNQLRV